MNLFKSERSRLPLHSFLSGRRHFAVGLFDTFLRRLDMQSRPTASAGATPLTTIWVDSLTFMRSIPFIVSKKVAVVTILSLALRHCLPCKQV